MSAFSDLLAAHKAEKASAPRNSKIVPLTLKGTLVRVKLYELDSDEWARIVAHCPPDVKAPMDRAYGYSMSAVTVAALPVCGYVLEGDEEIRPRVVPDEGVNEWSDLLKVIAGSELVKLEQAVFSLNQWEPDQRIEAAKKALAGASAQKRESPEPSASQPAASTGGNRAARRTTSTRKAT